MADPADTAAPSTHAMMTRSKAKAAELATTQATEAVQACGVKAPTDDQALQDHLQALSEHEAKYTQRRDEALAADASARTVGAHKAKLTEALGERAATQHMLDNFGPAAGDYKMLWGFSSGIGIDQLWYSESTNTYIIVEAKGPGAKLATNAKKGPQMSKKWVNNSLTEVANSDNCDDSDHEHIKAMRKGIKQGPPPQVQGLVLEAKEGGGAVVRPCPAGGIYHAT